MTIAVLKPDHLGDLVLSSPAIRALAQAHPDLVLFVGQRCVELARALFPNVAVQIFNLPHLTKEGESNGAPASLSHFDAVAILRHDGVITPSWASLRTRCYVMPVDNQGDHQTVLDYGVAREFVAPYDIDQLFYGARRDSVKQKAAIDPVQVGLAIGSGFYANSWPLVHWIELGRRLKVDGRRVKIVHGPAECAAAAILMSEIGLEAGDRVEGGGDFNTFFDRVSALDLVVASDGGTAHLCSLVTPIISIFGPSPLQRYAPFGPWNRVLSQLLECSPCLQFSNNLINGCLSVECMGSITANDVLAAIKRPVKLQDIGTRERLRPNLHLFKGLSHQDRARKLRRRDNDLESWTGCRA